MQFENQEGSDIDQKINDTEFDQFCKFEIFDQKSHFEFGDSRLNQLLKPDMLSQIDIPNEMSYPGIKSSCSALFDINQVSNNFSQDLESEGEKNDEILDGKFDQRLACSKKNAEDDIGLRVDSHQRRSFIHNALFRSETKINHQDLGYGSEEDCISESGEFEPGFTHSHESSMNYSNMG